MTKTFKAMGDLPDDVVENFKNKEYDICKEKCIGIVTSNPNHGFAFFYLGKIAESENDFQTAIAHFKRVMEIAPRMPFIWSCVGENYTKLEKYEEAYEAYTEEIALMPRKAIPWCMAARNAQEFGGPQLAIRILKLAQEKVEKEGQSIIAYTLGTLEEAVGNNNEALVNYVQGQMTALDEENRIMSAESIYRLLKNK